MGEMFEQGAYEVYETIRKVCVEYRVEDTPANHAKQKLDFGAMLKVIRKHSFEREVEVKNLEENEALVLMTN